MLLGRRTTANNVSIGFYFEHLFFQQIDPCHLTEALGLSGLELPGIYTVAPNLLLRYKSIVFLKKHDFLVEKIYLYVLPLGMVLVTCSIQRVYIFDTSSSFHFSSCPSQSLLAYISWFIRRPGIMNRGIQRIKKLKGNFPTNGTFPNFSMKIVSRTLYDFQIDDSSLFCNWLIRFLLTAI